MARFTDIERAVELMAAKTKVEEWRAKTREQKKLDYKNSLNGGRVRTSRVSGYIFPFGVAPTAKVVLPCNKILSPSNPGTSTGTDSLPTETAPEIVNLIVGVTGTRVLTSLPTDWKEIEGQNFKFAKITLKAKGNTPTRKISRLTGIGYQSYESQSVTAPFGQKETGETFEAAKSDMEANASIKSWLAATDSGKRSVKISPV